MSFTGNNISIRGKSHITRNLPCQDSSAVLCTDEYAIAVVSDGHGGEKYIRSNIGSRIAVDSSISVLKEYMSDMARFRERLEDDPDGLLMMLSKRIIAEWNTRVDEYDSSNPQTPAETFFLEQKGLDIQEYQKKYGATLVISVLTEFASFGIQIGDGDLVAIRTDGYMSMPMPEDEYCVGNVTTSLCSRKASEYVRYYCDKPADASLVSSDGLITTFRSEESYMRYCRNIMAFSDGTQEYWEKLVTDFEKRSQSNREDDVSVAMVVNESSDFSKLRERIVKTSRKRKLAILKKTKEKDPAAKPERKRTRRWSHSRKKR